MLRARHVFFLLCSIAHFPFAHGGVLGDDREAGDDDDNFAVKDFILAQSFGQEMRLGAVLSTVMTINSSIFHRIAMSGVAMPRYYTFDI